MLGANRLRNDPTRAPELTVGKVVELEAVISEIQEVSDPPLIAQASQLLDADFLGIQMVLSHFEGANAERRCKVVALPARRRQKHRGHDCRARLNFRVTLSAVFKRLSYVLRERPDADDLCV